MKQIRWTITTPDTETSFTLPQPCRLFTIGRDRTDIAVYSKAGVKLTCMVSEEQVVLRGEGETRIQNGDGEVQTLTAFDDITVTVTHRDAGTVFTLTVTFAEEDQPVYDRRIELLDGTHSFGSDLDATVTVPTIGQGQTAFFLIHENDHTFIQPGDVPLGVYVNESRVMEGQQVELNPYDFIFTAGSTFVYTGNRMLMTTNNIQVNALNYRDRTDSISHLEYPHMIRTSRYHYVIPSEEIEVLDPPKLQDKGKQNILMTLMPLIAMVALVLVMNRTGGGAGSMLMSVGMMGVGAITSVYTILRDKKEYREKAAKRLTDYSEYLQERETYIQACREDEREVMKNIYITPEQELQNVREFSPELFDRTAADEDFLHIRLGYGRLLSRRQVKRTPHKELSEQDQMIHEPERLQEKYRYNENLPGVIDATKANAIGVLGDMTSLRETMNIATLDLVTRHLPEDVELYLLCDRDFDEQLNAYRMLPHVWNGQMNRRNIANDMESRNLMLEELYKRLADREASEGAAGSWIVIYVHSDSEVMQHPLMKFIPRAAELHVVFVFWSEQREDQPIGCTVMVRLFNNQMGGVIVDMYDKNPDQPFQYQAVPDEVLEEVGRHLSPVYVSEISLASQLTDKYTLYDTLKISEPKAEQVLENWKAHSPQKSLSVPIGIASNNALQYLDLHEKAHGPHGLVAGTTGSGKSEVIISYLMSLCWHFSPEDVNIVVIDFKGGGMGNQLEGLPHLTSVITNLGAGELLRSLASIKAELIVRQQMLADAKVGNISDYTREYKAGRLEKPLPHLLLVVDEFAELKAQQPEFMDELISAARIGRSLGVHLILSTQKPHGVVNDQILSNMDFRMCLRVQTREDSNEMLESPLAAEIREPGRAYIKVNRAEMFQLFQSGYSGGSIATTGDKQNAFQVNEVSLTGRRKILFRYAPPKKSEDEKAKIITQFMTVREAIIDAYKQSGIAEPRKLCLPPLPSEKEWEPAETESRYQVPIGLVDIPSVQIQVPLTVDLTGKNLMIVGGSQMGKTTMLQTIIRAAAENMTSKEVGFYVMDFNSGVFKTMEKLSVIGGVVTLDDEERMKNLIKMLRTEIAVRKEKLLEASVLTFPAYLETGADDMSAMVLMIDNFVVFKEVYDEKYGGELLQILRDGPAVGLSVIVTTAQASALGYKRICYFDNRIAFHCSDTSEYSSALEGCRRTLPEIPGRVLLRMNKELVEAQVYQPFAGENDQERSADSKRFISEHSAGERSQMIPEIPTVLTADVVTGMFGSKYGGPSIPYALGYSEVEPMWLDMTADFEISLIGTPKVGNGDKTMLRFLMEYAVKYPDAINIRVVDGYEKALRQYSEADNITYSLEAADAPVFVGEVAEIARDRFDQVDDNGMGILDEMPAEVVVLNSMEAITAVSEDKEAMRQFERMSQRYRRMRIFFVFAGIDNKAVSYSGPELLKHIRDTRQAIIFENAGQIKFFDIGLMEIRANAEKLGRDDAFFVSEEKLQRIRLVSPKAQE